MPVRPDRSATRRRPRQCAGVPANRAVVSFVLELTRSVTPRTKLPEHGAGQAASASSEAATASTGGSCREQPGCDLSEQPLDRLRARVDQHLACDRDGRHGLVAVRGAAHDLGRGGVLPDVVQAHGDTTSLERPLQRHAERTTGTPVEVQRSRNIGRGVGAHRDENPLGHHNPSPPRWFLHLLSAAIHRAMTDATGAVAGDRPAREHQRDQPQRRDRPPAQHVRRPVHPQVHP